MHIAKIKAGNQFILLILLLLLTGCVTTTSSLGPEPANKDGPITPVDSKVLMSTVVAFRNAAIQEPAAVLRYITMMPPTGITAQDRNHETMTQAWSHFFKNVIIKAGNVKSKTPSVLYYNPLLDIGIVTLWENRHHRRFDFAGILALPGEYFSGETSTKMAVMPQWVGRLENESIGKAVSDLTSRRMKAFAAVYPAEAAEPAGFNAYRQSARQAQAAAEYRLLANLNLLTSLLKNPLQESLVQFRTALVKGDTGFFKPVDEQAVSELMRLPAKVRNSIHIDAVYSLANDHRLVVLSLPRDGRHFILAYFEPPAPFHLAGVSMFTVQ